MGVNLSGRGAPAGDGALPVRRSCRERCDSVSELAKSDPRAEKAFPKPMVQFSPLITEGCGLR
jgi:hypothetical protein